VIVRGAVSTGFRAPSLAQSFFSSTATNFLSPALGQPLVAVDSLTLPVNSPAAKVLGAVPLRPENSRNASAGVVVTPVRDLEVAVDYYHIAIDHRIVLSGNFTAAPVAALLAPFGANGARFFTNAIDTRTNGVDVSATYRVALEGAGAVDLRAGYNNTRTKITGTIDTPQQLKDYSSVLFDHIEQNRLQCGQPKDSVRLGGQWRRRALGVDVNENRYGSFCSTVTKSPADDQIFAAKWITDLEASYRVAGYRLAVGAENLFDVFPDRNSVVNSFNGIQTFPSQSPFGMNGRTLYARLGWTF
jgi:iron complex outermembrane receptor protein